MGTDDGTAGREQRERERLRSLYAEKSDGELELLAKTRHELAPYAQELFDDEVRRRGLSVENTVVQPTTIQKPEPADELFEASYRELVTIGQFRDIPEALLAKGSLDSAGIENFLVDDNLVRIDWFLSNAIGNIRLKVRPEDAEDATAILIQPPPESIDVEGVGQVELPTCPTCASRDVDLWSARAMDLSVLLATGLPIHVGEEKWICRACGEEWKEE